MNARSWTTAWSELAAIARGREPRGARLVQAARNADSALDTREAVR